MQTTEKEINQLRQRYDLRASGEEMRNIMEESPELFPASAKRMRALDSVSNKMKGRDRMFFRQGFLFRAGQLKGE